MNAKYLIVAMVETIIKVAILAAVIVFVFRGATQAYDFGYRVFADEPVSSSGGRVITVGIAEDASVKDIAQMLEERGLIRDAKLFVVQELLSANHGKILPGIYDLSTDMKAEEMLDIMATPAKEETSEGEGSQTEDGSPAEGEGTKEASEEGASGEGGSQSQEGGES